VKDFGKVTSAFSQLGLDRVDLTREARSRAFTGVALPMSAFILPDTPVLGC